MNISASFDSLMNFIYRLLSKTVAKLELGNGWKNNFSVIQNNLMMKQETNAERKSLETEDAADPEEQ